jgi:4-aminobutyrate aminotransferase-like enzyme
MLDQYFRAENLRWFFDLYSTKKTNLAAGVGRHDYLVDSIAPTDRLAVAGQGARIDTTHGPLIDFQSMTVNCILGQNDPWVKMQQIAYLLSERPSFHTTKLGSELYYSVPERLLRLGVGGLRDAVVSHRQCNGSDAVEHAIKAASAAAKNRPLLVSFEGSYHGQNLTAYNVSDVQRKHVFLAQSGSVVYLPAPDGAASIHDDVPLTQREEDSIARLREIGARAFALILEPIQMNNGVQPYSRAYLQRLRTVCAELGVALIYDEVQTGFGWLGTLSAAEFFDAVPDIAAFGKAITAGNGPLAITIAAKRFKHMPHGTATKTNGADVRSLVAAHAVLDRLVGAEPSRIPAFLAPALKAELRSGLLATVPATARLLWDCLSEVKRGSRGAVRAVKGGGLMCGLEVVNASGEPDEALVQRIMDRCFENGLFLRTSKNVLIVKIPATTTASQLIAGCEIVGKCIAEESRALAPSQGAARPRAVEHAAAARVEERRLLQSA